MRHDPAGASIVIMLRSLKLHGMAQAVDDLVAQGAPAFEAATPMLSQLLKAEMARMEREVAQEVLPVAQLEGPLRQVRQGYVEAALPRTQRGGERRSGR